MAPDKAHLQLLAASIQDSVSAYDPEDKASCIRIQDALETLRRAAEPPQVFITKQRFHTVENVAIITAVELGLLRALVAHNGKSLTASDLAKQSGYDELFIARIMRAMTALGFADETGYQSYTANAITVCQSDPGSEGGLILSNDMVFPLATKLRQYLQRKKPCNMAETPPGYDYAMGESVWETLKKDDEWKKGFDDNMTTRNKMLSIPWHLKYPVVEELTSLETDRALGLKKPVIVDIGGNQGVDLQRLADSFPDLDCELILEDLPETLKGVPGQLDARIRPISYDFFAKQPVEGADIYYLKSVLHDWDNEASRKILSNTAKVMKPESRLLINEMVLADTNENIMRTGMDMLMLFVLNGMERTRTQWETLLASVEPPLSILQIWSAPGDQQSVIETCLAQVASSITQ